MASVGAGQGGPAGVLRAGERARPRGGDGRGGSGAVQPGLGFSHTHPAGADCYGDPPRYPPHGRRHLSAPQAARCGKPRNTRNRLSDGIRKGSGHEVMLGTEHETNTFILWIRPCAHAALL